jgi:aspartate-semialdehyde dehydrogenase
MTTQKQIVSLSADRQTLAGGKLKTAVLGATGMVGQQLISLLASHPWFEVVTVAASQSSAGKRYRDAVAKRWAMSHDIPSAVADMTLLDVQSVDEISAVVDLAFCALNLNKEAVVQLEDAYARRGVWLTSNNSAHRAHQFVPMVIPAVNAEHLQIVPTQRKAMGFTTGAIVVKSNCSIQSYVIALEPLREFGVEEIRVHSEQAISGAGKTFLTFPESERNLIPFIDGEERKSEVEPLKIWGTWGPEGFVSAETPKISARCVRVGVLHGHTAYVDVKFTTAPSVEEILGRWENFKLAQSLPTGPQKLIHYLQDHDRPQPRLDVMTDGGMAVSVGQLKTHDNNRVSFTALSHNLILGAAGGAILATEAAIDRGLVYRRVN